jgi:hypothetical protein
MRVRQTMAAVLVLALALGACGGASSPRDGASAGNASSFATPFTNNEVYPVFVSSEITVGRNRFLVGLLNDNDAPVGSPRVDMTVAFFDLESSAEQAVATTPMRWVWIDRPYAGLYVGEVTFDDAGRWGAEVRVSGPRLDETVRSSFDVRAETSTPAVGERVPASDTPTVDDAPLATISTDNDPTPRFYEASVAETLAAGRPFVVVFATPKFCTSQTCGPMLDVVEGVARGFPSIRFIHVEPYQLPPQDGQLEPVRAATEWGLPSEPWIFVVNGRGRLAAKYEGAVSASELRHELRHLR